MLSRSCAIRYAPTAAWRARTAFQPSRCRAALFAGPTRPFIAEQRRFSSTASAGSSSGGGWDASRIGGTLAGLLFFPAVCYFTLNACGLLDVPERRPREAEGEEEEVEEVLVGDVTLVNKVSLGGPFEMTDCANGQRVRDDALLNGKWTMLYFGFTRCAEICPSTMAFMQRLYEGAQQTYKGTYDEEVAKMQVLFVSIDHLRDKPDDLKKFLAKYSVPSRGVVPNNREDVENVTRPWRVYISSVDETEEEKAAREAKGIEAPDPMAENYQLDHSAAIYFVGPDGKLKDYFFKEIPLEQAVDRLSLHFSNAYGLNK